MPLKRLLRGFRDFRTGYFREHLDLFEKLASEGQSPRILIVGCADARVDLRIHWREGGEPMLVEPAAIEQEVRILRSVQ